MDKKGIDKWVRFYSIVISVFAILVFFISIRFFNSNYGMSNSQILMYSIVFGVSTVISDIYPIIYFPDKENQAEITISLALTLAMAFILPPVYTILTKTMATIIDERIKTKNKPQREWDKVLFNTAYLAIVSGITSITFHSLYSFHSDFLFYKNIIVLLIGGIVYFFTETFILFTLLSYLNKESFSKFWLENIKAIHLELLTLFPLGYLLIYIYIKNFWVSILLIPLLIAIYFASQEKVQIINQSEKTLYALAKLEDNKFPDTMAHSVRVGNLSELLCEKLGKNSKEKEIVVKAAKLHDIGKVAIPDAIINKKGKLTEEEFAKIKEHPVKGAELVSYLSSFRNGERYIRYHHERWDGKGYPEGLKEKDIPEGARIISIVDSFDAMISNRPYKKAKTIIEALEEIKKEGGRQFDPKIATVFVDMIKKLINDKKIINNHEEFEKYFPKDAKIDK